MHMEDKKADATPGHNGEREPVHPTARRHYENYKMNGSSYVPGHLFAVDHFRPRQGAAQPIIPQLI